MEPNENSKILIITINISENVQGKITVHENDDPSALSDEFLSKYSLDQSMKGPLMSVIKFHQDKFKAKQVPSSSKQGSIHKKSSTFQRLLHNKHSSLTNLHSNPQLNYGHLLYEKGRRMQEKTRNMSEKKAFEKDSRSQKELTFQPKISKNSIEISKNRDKEKREGKSKKRMMELQKKAEMEEMKECYFVPLISAKPGNSEKKNIFTALYADACQRQKPLEEKPIDMWSFIQDQKKNEAVVERLLSYKVKGDEEIEKLRKDLEQNIDKVTGQKLFTPVICRNPLSARGDRPIWEELYNLKDSKKKMSNGTYLDIRENTQKNHLSEKLFLQFRKRKFQGIFIKLDSDNDGKVSSEKIDLSLLSTKVLKIISPVFDDILEGNLEIEVEEFVERLEAIYEKTNTQEKMMLVKGDLKVTKENYSFVPEINKNSSRLAGGAHLGSTLYERATAAKEIRELKCRKAKELKESKELSKTTR